MHPERDLPHAGRILEIADCLERISLEFELHSELQVENSLHKVDVPLRALTESAAGLVETARLYRECEPEVEKLNRSAPARRRDAAWPVPNAYPFRTREARRTPPQATQQAHLQGYYPRALRRTRSVDPLLTMRP